MEKNSLSDLMDSELLSLVLNSMQHGTMITDSEGYVRFFSDKYAEFLGLKAQEQIGRHCTEVMPSTRMHIVVKTGKAEINEIQIVDGREWVVQRLPLKKNGKVIGGIGMIVFENKNDVTLLERRLSAVKKQLRMYHREIASYHGTRYTMHSIVGTSPAVTALKATARRAAATGLPVLIQGETGTGKEVLAQAIHSESGRSGLPFVRINCSVIPKELMESELFGYEAGAFTGARAGGAMGRFETAGNGTVFLDEIGDMPLDMQTKLLNVLEEKTFYRVGGNAPVAVDFRIISATNRNLEEQVAKGLFREDLYYRVNAVPLWVPPLRDRPEDILPLAEYAVTDYCMEHGQEVAALAPQTRDALKAYAWPGNIRELIHCMQYAQAFHRGPEITPSDLPPAVTASAKSLPGRDAPGTDLKHSKLEAERAAILHALETCGGNRSKAARMLGIHRSLLYRRMDALGLY